MVLAVIPYVFRQVARVLHIYKSVSPLQLSPVRLRMPTVRPTGVIKQSRMIE